MLLLLIWVYVDVFIDAKMTILATIRSKGKSGSTDYVDIF